MIEEIFGWEIAYLVVLLFAGSTFIAHFICLNFINGKVDFGLIIPFLWKILEIFVMVTSC
jgi:hypothetical protein